MSYEDWRTRSIQSMSNSVVREFVNRYRCKRPTVVLLPGGMGSQLDRSLDSYIDGRTPPIDYDPVWIDLGTIFDGQARSLQIEDNGRDRDSHVIIADGALRFFVNAYDATEQFFRDENVNANYVVFGYDWRRPLAESAAFLERFLKQIQIRVFAKHREDPLPNLSLLAHSQGGLVAKIFLHNVVDISAWIKQLITVGTPFYGTWSQQKRYFVGESMLRAIYPASEMAPIISSLPGPYGLMFPPRSIFDTYGAQLGLKRYPMRTAADADGADPYAIASLNLYPTWINTQHLYNAGQVYWAIAAPLPQEVAQRVYNIRSIAEDTPVELAWKDLPSNFNPDNDDSPVWSCTQGKGDGTVPHWSAFHANVPITNRKELTKGKDHTFLMEDPQVLGFVEALINGRSTSDADMKPTVMPTAAGVATTDEVNALCNDIAASKVRRDDPRLVQASMWRGIYREMTR